ncbi:hypothetical protein HYD77_03045 [Mycoplasmopsis bovis]|nr:hypothetical protein [Mycoplasmopsis bovis]QQH43630.1 hypothetical protein HYD77_03045 [Mycoplasmopsis bovis]
MTIKYGIVDTVIDLRYDNYLHSHINHQILNVIKTHYESTNNNKKKLIKDNHVDNWQMTINNWVTDFENWINNASIFHYHPFISEW